MAEKDANLKDKDDKLDKKVEVKFSPEQQAKLDSILKGRIKTIGEKHEEELKNARASSREDLANKFGITVNEIEQILEGNINSKKLEAVAEQAAKMNVDPEFLVKVNEVVAENADLKAKEKARNELAEITNAAKAEFDEQLKQFEDKYKEIDVVKLNKDTQFNKLYSRLGKNVTLIEAYETYADIVGDARAQEIANRNRKEERHIGGGDNLDINDAYALLDEEQKKLCKENDIDPKKFLEDLKRSAYYKG